MDLTTFYKTKKKQHRKVIQNLRGETLLNCYVLLSRIQTDIKTYPRQIRNRQLQLMSTKAQRLKDLIDTVVSDVETKYRTLFINVMQQMKTEMERKLASVQNYEH
jgi:hypothetical protein